MVCLSNDTHTRRFANVRECARGMKVKLGQFIERKSVSMKKKIEKKTKKRKQTSDKTAKEKKKVYSNESHQHQ